MVATSSAGYQPALHVRLVEIDPPPTFDTEALMWVKHQPEHRRRRELTRVVVVLQEAVVRGGVGPLLGGTVARDDHAHVAEWR